MRKVRNSKLALILVLTMLATMFVGVGTASAATTYSVLATPTIGTDGSYNLGTTKVFFDTLESGKTSTAILSLPKDYVIEDGDIAFETNSTGATVDFSRTGLNDNEFKMIVTAGGTSEQDIYVLVTLSGVYVPASAPTGEVKLSIEALSGQFVGGEVVVAKVADGMVTASVKDVPSITEAGTTDGTIEITFKENRAGAFASHEKSLKLTLPPGFAWNVDDAGWTSLSGTAVVNDIWVDDTNDRILYVDITAGTKSAIRVYADIDVDSSKASFGDVTVKLGGESDVTPSSLVIAKYAEYGVTVSAKSTPDAWAGRLAQDIGDIVIEEAAPNSLVAGRTVTLTLPETAKWAEVGNVTSEGGLGTTGDPVRVGDDGRTIKVTIEQADDNTAGKLTLKDVTVDLALVTANYDLKVEVAGSAGAKGEVVVAKVLAPVTASAAAKSEVKIGMRDQAAADITITEAKAEALIQGKTLEVVLAKNVLWSKKPTVKVTAGNLEIDNVKTNDETLSFKITGESTTASTITISGVLYTVDRTVPEGDITVKVKGTAIDEVNDLDELPAAGDRDFYDVADFEDDGLFPDYDYAAKFSNATCVTPAPGQVMGVAIFKIGQASYNLNGVDVAMDVAPYIKDGRTMLPVRFVANAVGVSDNNIIWDAVSKTVTIIKGDRVIQMTVGSKTMLLNGAAIVMDVAPEIVSGRTMIPLRFAGQALGAEILWDAATQTVTVNF